MNRDDIRLELQKLMVDFGEIRSRLHRQLNARDVDEAAQKDLLNKIKIKVSEMYLILGNQD